MHETNSQIASRPEYGPSIGTRRSKQWQQKRGTAKETSRKVSAFDMPFYNAVLKILRLSYVENQFRE